MAARIRPWTTFAYGISDSFPEAPVQFSNNGPYATQLFERIELYQYVMKIRQPRCQIGKMQHTR